jgi:hypothetical protein
MNKNHRKIVLFIVPIVLFVIGCFIVISIYLLALAPRLTDFHPTSTPSPTQTSGLESTNSEDNFLVVDELLNALADANIAFNTPDRMKQDETTEILLILSPKLTADEVKELVEEELGESEQNIEVAEIKASTWMEAKLVGSSRAFEIIEKSSALQAISFEDETRWAWEVIALEEGTHSLDLTLTAFISFDGTEVPRTIKTYHRTITVEVTGTKKALQFVQKNLYWLILSVAIISIGFWFFNRVSKKQKTRKPPVQKNLQENLRQPKRDIFISYASEDRERLRPYLDLFSRNGWSVWWDQDIPIGKSFDDVIEEAIEKSRCVIVIWSEASVSSDWVRTEAGEGKSRGVLIPVLIDEVEIPLAFRRIETAQLQDWDGESDHPEVSVLLKAITDILEK